MAALLAIPSLSHRSKGNETSSRPGTHRVNRNSPDQQDFHVDTRELLAMWLTLPPQITTRAFLVHAPATNEHDYGGDYRIAQRNTTTLVAKHRDRAIDCA